MSTSNHVNGTAAKEPVPTEVQEPGRRRIYTEEYKRQIVREVTAAPRGGIGVILRREGLYSTTVDAWRKEIAGVRTAGKAGRKASLETPLKKEVERLKRENERLKRKLEHAALIIAVQKKYSSADGLSLRERRREIVGEVQELAATVGITAACEALALPRSSFYRKSAELAGTLVLEAGATAEAATTTEAATSPRHSSRRRPVRV